MALPNMKTFVIAVCKPFIWALRCFYDRQVTYLTKLANRQNEIITELQAQVTDLNTVIEKQSELIVRYKTEVADIQKNIYTSDQVKTMSNRLYDLTTICGALYDKVYELMHTGTVKDPTLPPFNPTPTTPSDPPTNP